MLSAIAASAALLLAASACDRGGEDPAVEYAEVAGVLRTHCVSCHQPGGLADFSLTTYEDARSRADQIAGVTSGRSMPPIPAVADGSCRSFTDATWLTPAELDLLAQWAADGAPASAGVEDVGALPARPELDADALTVPMQESYRPRPMAGEQDDYRCFALDPSLAAPAVVTAIEYALGNRELVHHVAVYAIDPTQDLGPFTNAEGIALMEAADAEPGWSCFSGIGPAAAPRSQIGGWSGGSPVVEMPAGSGMTLFAGELLVLQLHYRVHEGDEHATDRSAIRLQLAADARHRVTAIFQDPITFATDSAPSLPAGSDAAEFHWELPASVLWDELERQEGASVAGLRLVGVGPHMHNLGTAFALEVTPPGGAPSCGIDVQRWDFAWQRSYFYAEPIEITDPETSLRVTCRYDTTSSAVPVFAGHDAGHEMCGLLSYVTAL